MNEIIKMGIQICCFFVLFIDFKGHYLDENVQALFAKRKEELKWLGSYVAGFDFE